jgi:multisubunit Na+/H+ antiporter MnhG subunit
VTFQIMITDILLGVTVLSCWIGVIGMLRMREPMQALHYLSLPASLGVIALTGAVISGTGMSSTTLKTALIAVVLLGINSVVAHATARAFRTRELGHWEPRDGDPIEFVQKENARQENKA